MTSKSLKMDHTSLTDLIDMVISNLKTDYSIISTYTKLIRIKDDDMHLDWSLAHMNNSILELIRDLERHQQYLKKDMDG